MKERVEKKYNWLRVVGVIGAGVLIVFGSFANAWRTLKMSWDKFRS
jgi:hypothetical protein